MPNRPHSREKNTSGKSVSVNKRERTSTSSTHSSINRPQGSAPVRPRPQRNTSSYDTSRVTRGAGGSFNPLVLIIVAVVIFFLFKTMTSSSGGETEKYPNQKPANQTQHITTQNTNNGTYVNASYGSVNYDVAKGTREHFTKIKGRGKDTVTVMVYMCGADLESGYGMATADLNEMLYAQIDTDKINIVVQTGGCKRWRNTVISNTTCQRYLVTDKDLQPLDKNVGNLCMTDQDTFYDFLDFCKDEFPADRYMLIMWDHGGGSVSGYGYDENYRSKGSLSIDKIASAIKKSKIKFDIIGFDACLMGNYETALAVSPYADYLLASEESEPGTGWYYTDWLTQWSQNTSADSLDIAKTIIDTFTTASQKASRQAKTTLSVVDLGELANTIPDKLNRFATDLNDEITGSGYQEIADARCGTREFAADSKIDQIDLIDFAQRTGLKSGDALAKALQDCVKYNVTNNVTNAYGISAYFPYRRLSSMNSLVNIYENVGMDEEFSDAVKSFATLLSSGQVAAQNTGSSSNSLWGILSGQNAQPSSGYSDFDLYDMLFGAYTGSGSSSSSQPSGATFSFDDLLGGSMFGNSNSFSITDLFGGGSNYSSSLGSLFGGSNNSASNWMDSSLLSLFSNFIGRNHFEQENLKPVERNGGYVISMSEAQWETIKTIELNLLVDDGEGYIDLGRDNVFDFDEDGDLICDTDQTWLTINDHLVSYYLLSDEYDENSYEIQGYVPAELNGQVVNLILQFNDENPNGIVIGARPVDKGIATQANLIQINDGDTIDFICDYYDYDGNFTDSYFLGDTLTVSGDLVIENQHLEDANVVFSYCLSDIYNNQYWTDALTK